MTRKIVGTITVAVGLSAIIPTYLWLFGHEMHGVTTDQRVLGTILAIIFVYFGAIIGWAP